MNITILYHCLIGTRCCDERNWMGGRAKRMRRKYADSNVESSRVGSESVWMICTQNDNREPQKNGRSCWPQHISHAEFWHRCYGSQYQYAARCPARYVWLCLRVHVRWVHSLCWARMDLMKKKSKKEMGEGVKERTNMKITCKYKQSVRPWVDRIRENVRDRLGLLVFSI